MAERYILNISENGSFIAVDEIYDENLD